MLDKINGISNVNVSSPLQFDSFSNTYNTSFSVDSPGKSGGSSSPSGKLEEVMPLLIKLVEQLMEMSQSGSVDDSASSGEGQGGDGVVASAEESDSAGHSSSDSGENKSAAGSAVEGGMQPEQANAESDDDSSPSSQLEEIMPLLLKLVEQLMALLQGDSASGAGVADEGVASPDEASHSAGSSPADSGENNTAAETAMEGGMQPEQANAESGGDAAPSSQLDEIMPLLLKLVEQLMALLQGDSASGAGAAGEGVASPDEASHSAGSSPADSGEHNTAAETAVEGGMQPEQANAESGGDAAPSSQPDEIMPLLLKLVEQLMALLQGDSAGGEDTAGEGVASPDEASHSAGSSPADSGEHNAAAATPVEGGMQPEQANAESGGDASPSSQLEEIMPLLIKLVELLMAMLEGDSASGEGAAGEDVASPGEESHSAGNSPSESGGNNSPAVTSPEGSIKPETSNTGSGRIPTPTEHLQSFNLGGKSVTVGGDGTASEAEVQSTAESMKNLYQNSDTFRNMIDSSTDSGFEVSVGKRDDNTSWGSSEGRVFMNINNIEPGNDDTFQSLLGHEFAHASIDIGHGGQMEQLESAIAAEA